MTIAVRCEHFRINLGRCKAEAKWVVPTMDEHLLVCGNHRRAFTWAYPIGKVERKDNPLPAGRP